MSKAFIAIDVQNDFCPATELGGGALAVPCGDEVVPIINALLPRFEVRILTQDWHPAEHASFASSHAHRSPFEEIEVVYGRQTLWPDHCVQGSYGAEFHRDLAGDLAHVVIRKGFRRDIDSYSAFMENDRRTQTGLSGYLHGLGITHIVLAGLATDFCVKFSALDGIAAGFAVTIVSDGCRAIDLQGSAAQALQEMRTAGIAFAKSHEL